jgi:lipopolysaccharide export system permease protein
MRQITRYVLIEFLKVFTVTLVSLTVLLVFFVVAVEAFRAGLSLVNLARLLPYALPIAFLYAIPGTALFAACSVYGRMSADNEIIAVKSLGISPLCTVWPIVTLAFVLSVGVVWLNDFAVSWGRAGMQRVILESIEQIAYGMLRTPPRSYSDRYFSISVKDVVGDRLIRPLMTVTLREGEPPMVVAAEQASLEWDPEQNQLQIRATNFQVDFGDNRRMVYPDTQVIPIPLPAGGGGFDMQRPADTSLRRIPQAIARERARREQLETSLAAEAAYQMLTGDFAALADSQWNARFAELDEANGRLHRLHTEPWRRWANGFSCLAFILVGAPLAIRLRNSDLWTSFAICFMPVLLVYYPLLAYGVSLAKSGDLPPSCVWLGNLVFFAIGGWLMRSVAAR